MKNHSKITQTIEIIVMLALIFAVLYFTKEAGFADDLKPETRFEKTINIFGIILMGFIVLGVHELGHLLTGLYNGFRFDLYVVGPLGIKSEQEKIKVYLNKELSLYGGVAATSPVNDDIENAKKFARILLAGPIASVLFAIICFALAYLVGKPFGMMLYTGGLISVAIFFATTIPSKTGMFFTDRKRYQRLVTPGPDQEVELAMLNIMGKYAKDNSYKNIDIKDINTLTNDDLPFVKFYGLFNLYCHELETKGHVSEETKNNYESHSKSMSKNLVAAFEKELTRFKDHIQNHGIEN